jgi:hypothetical protein
MRCPIQNETFEKGSFLFKFKEGENFNHRHTISISRINPPKFGGGLKFERDPGEIGFAFHGASAEIGQKGGFSKVSQWIYRQGKPYMRLIVMYLRADVSVMRFHQPLDNGQADARTSMLP